jgi:hypothetical protein
MNEVLAFDWGTTIVGVLDVHTDVYTPYRGKERMIEGAKRILSAVGTIVSFNGIDCDLPKLFELLRLDRGRQDIRATHDDMLVITSTIRWPPDPGTLPIFGKGLLEMYTYYCGYGVPAAPLGLSDEYEANNWRDCYMTAELWMRWRHGDLAS